MPSVEFSYALGVGVNAFPGCAGIIPAAGNVRIRLASFLLRCVWCRGSCPCVFLFERFFSSAGARSVGAGVAGLGEISCRPVHDAWRNYFDAGVTCSCSA